MENRPKIMTDNKLRSNLILKTLYCYPTMAGLNAEAGAAMVASYMEVLAIYPDDVLKRALFKIKCSSEKYAPSAGAIFEACAEVEDGDAGCSSTYPTPKKLEMEKNRKDRLAALNLPTDIPTRIVQPRI